jgi:hypothetical protein
MDVVFDDPPVELGRGSSGRVFAGTLRGSQQAVAVKKVMLPPDEAARALIIDGVAKLQVCLYLLLSFGWSCSRTGANAVILHAGQAGWSCERGPGAGVLRGCR